MVPCSFSEVLPSMGLKHKVLTLVQITASHGNAMNQDELCWAYWLDQEPSLGVGAVIASQELESGMEGGGQSWKPEGK